MLVMSVGFLLVPLFTKRSFFLYLLMLCCIIILETKEKLIVIILRLSRGGERLITAKGGTCSDPLCPWWQLCVKIEGEKKGGLCLPAYLSRSVSLVPVLPSTSTALR